MEGSQWRCWSHCTLQLCKEGLVSPTSFLLHIIHFEVRLEDGKLVWPVLFLYPEKGETDFIEEFRWFCKIAPGPVGPKMSSTTPCGLMPGIFLICFKEIAWKLTDGHREEEQFVQHLEVMLGKGVERPGWDFEARFTPANLQIYFENKSQELVKVT